MGESFINPLPSGSANPLPSSSARAESSLSSLSSSSSSGCRVSFSIDGPLEDHRGIEGARDVRIEVKVAGCELKNAYIKFTIVPVEPNPQNAINSTDWLIKPEFDDRIQGVFWASPPWYASAPNRLCAAYPAPYDVSVVYTCPHAICRYGPVRVNISLPNWTENRAGATYPGAGPDGAVAVIRGPYAVQSIPNWYVAYLVIYGYRRVPAFEQGDRFSQYRGKTELEEREHVRQAVGPCPFEEGGLDDLWTRKGFLWWLNFAGEGPFPFYGNTELEAYNQANIALQYALSKENEECSKLLQQREALREKRAKEVAGYNEAYTLRCTYPQYANITFPPYPPKHPAYA